MDLNGCLKREWFGPRFWKILHSLAEKSGVISDPVLQLDEQEAWILLIQSIPGCMPCLQCRKHFLEWIRLHPFSGVRNKKGTERREFIRSWLYNLHSNVNQRSQKEISINLEDCNRLYTAVIIEDSVKELSEMFRIGLLHSRVNHEDVEKWKRTLIRLRILYGF